MNIIAQCTKIGMLCMKVILCTHPSVAMHITMRGSTHSACVHVRGGGGGGGCFNIDYWLADSHCIVGSLTMPWRVCRSSSGEQQVDEYTT